MEFDYDAFGRRIAKHVHDQQGLLVKSTYYVLDAQGNQLSTYEHVVDNEENNYQLAERVMYGSSRLGINTNKVDMLDEDPEEIISLSLGNKLYEMSNHLGNVLTVINDIKIPISSDSIDVDGYLATIVSTADYSPFGVHLDERTVSAESYRYGFQGQEKDDEIKGAGNSVNYTYRMHDPRLGRFFAIDPLASDYPWNSPYAFSENKVIHCVEIEGLEGSLATAGGAATLSVGLSFSRSNGLSLNVTGNAIFTMSPTNSVLSGQIGARGRLDYNLTSQKFSGFGSANITVGGGNNSIYSGLNTTHNFRSNSFVQGDFSNISPSTIQEQGSVYLGGGVSTQVNFGNKPKHIPDFEVSAHTQLNSALPGNNEPNLVSSDSPNPTVQQNIHYGVLSGSYNFTTATKTFAFNYLHQSSEQTFQQPNPFTPPQLASTENVLKLNCQVGVSFGPHGRGRYINQNLSLFGSLSSSGSSNPLPNNGVSSVDANIVITGRDSSSVGTNMGTSTISNGP